MVSMWYCVSLHRCIYIYLHVYCLYSSRKCLFIYMYLCLINLPVVNYLSNKLVTIHITRLTVWRSFLCADACRVCISSTLTVSTSGYHRTKSVPFAASISRRLRKVTCRWSSAAAPLWQNSDRPSCDGCLFHGRPWHLCQEHDRYMHIHVVFLDVDFDDCASIACAEIVCCDRNRVRWVHLFSSECISYCLAKVFILSYLIDSSFLTDVRDKLSSSDVLLSELAGKSVVPQCTHLR